jgi:hypothetical protein
MLYGGMLSVKCKKKVTVDNAEVKRDTTSKGRAMLRAVCHVCGAKMTKFTK